MQHWYVYHSVNTMGHTYESLGEIAVYSKKNQPKLCKNDLVWVIEGDLSTPKEFMVVDCFHYTDTDYPPFPSKYSNFELKIIGDKSLLSGTLELKKNFKWFESLHAKFITKQKFFERLNTEPAIAEGLIELSQIKF